MTKPPAEYVLHERLGEGTTSQVWRADHVPTLTPVALKVARGASQAGVLLDEAERLAFVASPALAGLRDVGRWGADDGPVPRGAIYVALDWAAGAPLLPTRIPAEERVDLALVVARDVGAALADLHRAGTAHGDVKPGNIVVGGDPLRAVLVDLGLGDRVDAREPRGGTRRYLAPEVFGTTALGDAGARDLWALGLTLAEIASSEIADAADPRAQVERVELEPRVRALCEALLAPQPSARPGAAWLLSRVRALLGARPSATAERAARQQAVRLAYLAVRRQEVLAAAGCESCDVQVDGLPGAWLRDSVHLAQRIARLRGMPSPVRRVLAELGDVGRSRWLVALAGVEAAAWSVEPTSDAALAARLSALVTDVPVEALTLARLTGRSLDPVVAPEPVALALALGAGTASLAELEAAEALVARGPRGEHATLGVALGRALRLRGELGRALAVLREVDTPEAHMEAAEVARRARDGERSRWWLARARQVGATPEVEARCAAVAARLALDEGEPTAALDLVASVADTAAVLEVRALAASALGDRSGAQRAVQRARSVVRTDEERARLAGVTATLAHARGDMGEALVAFRAAAEHAAHAGAVLEDATYLTGVAAAAASLGDTRNALAASLRSTLLFEHLGRPREAARAVLTRAAAFAQVGAVEEARAAAEDAIARARVTGDRACQAYAHLALADVLPADDRDGLEHARRAQLLLGAATDDDRLRVAARLLARGEVVDHATCDRLARAAPVALDARVEWWGARARAAFADPGSDAVGVLTELQGGQSAAAPVAARGPALAAGAELAARLGAGEAARQLASGAAQAARELLERAPVELRGRAASLPWVLAIQSPREAALTPEQITDVETLVRALGRRDRLRPLLDQVLDALVLWTGVERGLLLLRAPGDRLVPRAGRNLARSDLVGPQLELSHSLARRALAERGPVVAVDAAGELPEMHASVHALKLRSVLAVPLLARGEVLGVVYLDDRMRRGAFGPRELAWVRLVATLAAVAIADARDQLLLRRAARRATRAEARLAQSLARSEAALDVAARELARARDARDTRFSYDEIVGRSEPVRAMLRVVDRVTATDVPVLVVGASGSGKELIARAIHANGSRGSKAFVSENCGAIPEPLLESALFGHVRGAFTGANRPRAGLFEIAHGGTLFLDEVGEMSLGMQTKLLRVLESGEVRPVGSERERKVDVRVIGATHRELDRMVAAGTFREDLYYRLNVITIRVPSLRERPGDIELLVRHFVRKHAPSRPPVLTPAAAAALAAYEWPGNVRQLENEVRRALVLADGAIDVVHLSPVVAASGVEVGAADAGLNVRRRVDALEATLVREALDQTQGNQTRAAELLGLSRYGLQKMIRRLGIGGTTRYAGTLETP